MLLSTTLLALPAMATTPDQTSQSSPHQPTTYSLSDFTQFAPHTAFDVVNRVPGFSIDNGDTGQRGFGQASANVLINGQRISGKSNTVRDALNRIPAKNIERVELLDGATLDLPGVTGQVVNVVASIDGVSGAWSWRARFLDGAKPYFDRVDLSAVGSSGGLEWTVGVKTHPYQQSLSGPEFISSGAGEPLFYREETQIHQGDRILANGALTWTSHSGAIANLNAELGYDYRTNRETRSDLALDGGDATGSRIWDEGSDKTSYEVGADYEFGLGSGRMKLIALARAEQKPTDDTLYYFNASGQQTLGLRYISDTDTNEAILRGEYGWSFNDRADWRISVEGAFNSLENTTYEIHETSQDGFAPPDVIPPATRVEETRAESFLSWTRRLGPDLSIQASLGAEFSEISQPSRDREPDSFTRPKGDVSVSYTPNKGLGLTASLKREVGQLNFGDFVDATDPNGPDSAGNADIVPQQSWVMEMIADLDFARFGAGSVSLYNEHIEDIVDTIPIEVANGTLGGPGNIDEARRYGVAFDGTLQLEPFGLSGARIDLRAETARSELEDPLTGVTRRISRDLVHFYDMDFRYDIPDTNFVFGFSLNTELRENAHLFSEFRDFKREGGNAFAFVEHKDLFGLTGAVFVGNLLDQDFIFYREFYDPDRSGTLTDIEDRTRKQGTSVLLSLRGSF